MSAVQVFYEGNVQGIGFRYAVKQIARGFDVTGFVRNLRDGRVELQASGEEEEVRSFLDAIAESELRAHIRKTTENSLPSDTSFSGFSIRHD
jgi:acylphosphatase